MLNLFKRNNKTTEPTKTEVSPEPKKAGLFKRLTQGLSKTRQQLSSGLSNLLLGKKVIDDDLLEELETQLLLADIGVDATQKIITQLTDAVSREQLSDGEALFHALQQRLQAMLAPCEQPLVIKEEHTPFVILMAGINGAGKTTTIGKLAKRLQRQGKSVLLAAGDTFRAAAIEQLQTWGERNAIDVIAQQPGSDSAAVIFDAMQAAKARKIDVLIADTAGRLHTQQNLMAEIAKVKRVLAKVDASAPHEVMLVLDAGTGQNALQQAKQFNETLDVSGITVTKLDGTAKGGIIFAIAEQLNIPIRFIGIGEQIDDLRPFSAKDFVSALFQ